MALVVETGSGDDASANSYDDLPFIKAYLTARAVAFPDDTALNAFAIRAMDYIEQKERYMYGIRTFGLAQPLSYPRDGVYLDGELLDNTVIPLILQNAEAELVRQLIAGVDIMPATPAGPQLQSRTVGPISRTFFKADNNITPFMPIVDGWLAPLLSNSGGFSLELVRI
jgi:hypothetical protein